MMNRAAKCKVSVICAGMALVGLLIASFVLDRAVSTGEIVLAQNHLRQPWQDFVNDPDRLRALQRGIQEMQRRSLAPKDSSEYRTSWEYWAAAHSYYGSRQSPSIEVYKSATPSSHHIFYEGLQDLTVPPTPPGVGQQIWDRCEHSSRTATAENFLAWHRLYLYFFERVLAQASGMPEFRLPYWDYTDLRHLQMPAEFGEESLKGLPNPLFDRRRTSARVVLSGRRTDVDRLLEEGDFVVFQEALEGGVHGHVHCALGNNCLTPLMGQVPAAALDPLFWLHHVNLDRLWECWRRRGGVIPQGEWRNVEYYFVDTAGDLTSRKIDDLFESDGSEYAPYASVTQCGRGPLAPLKESEQTADAPVITVATARNVSVSGGTVVIPLDASTADIPTRAFGEALSKSSNQTVELLLEDISAARPPGVFIDVYVEATDGKPRREYLGSINFFGLTPSGPERSRIGKRRFDMSSALRALGITSPTGYRVVLEEDEATAPAGRSQADMAQAAVEIGLVQVSVRVK